MDNDHFDHNIFPRLSLGDVLDQQFSVEFKGRNPPPSPSPPPPPPHPFGAIGEGRRQQNQGRPVAVPAPAGIAERPEGPHHHHLHEPMAPPPPPPPPGPIILLIPQPNLISRRPMCCSFCFGTATHWAIEMGVELPERDDPGVWSTHPCKEGGVVTCPFLWQVTCPLCGATGADAHTRSEHIRMGWR